MLTLSRRGFLSVGGFGMLSMPHILEAQQQNGKHKAVINIFLGGGPPHQDMWDIKTDAPTEIRGEFQPIDTAVPGIQIGESFPKIASMMDKFVAIRSVIGSVGDQKIVGVNYPSIGSVASKIQGPVNVSVPATIGLAEKTQHTPWSESGGEGYLGISHRPFKPNGEMMSDLTLNGISRDRLQARKDLLTGLGKIKPEGDVFIDEAFDVLTSSKLVDALDLSKEDPKVRERYGNGKPFKYQYDGAPTVNEHVLMARRLVEVGVRSVSLSYGRWDSHGANFDLVRDHGGKLDQCVSALVEDLDERGMLDDVTVVVWGEFGRTPKINKGAGRDHWPQVSCALLAGGGIKAGQTIGETNRLGEYAVQRPVHFQEITSTIYYNLGIDPRETTVIDTGGRPQYLLDHRDPLRELI
mgnify:CR=1 FL=1